LALLKKTLTFGTGVNNVDATQTKDLRHRRGCPRQQCHYVPFLRCSNKQTEPEQKLSMNHHFSTRVMAGVFCWFGVFGISAVSTRAASVTFTNANAITINDSLTPPTVAAPYPSSITVAGLAGQVVTKATVSLYGFSHGFPSDVDILLISPQGHRSIVMANAGGQNRYSVTNLNLTFDDDAASTLPIYTQLGSGTFKPTNGYAAIGYPNLPFEFPSPAPAGNSNSPTALAVFKNTDPSGTWKLFVVDDASGDSGTIVGGWSLTLSVGVQIQIERVQTNIVVSWPGSATNSSVQSSPGLSSAWSELTNAPGLSGGRYYVTNAITGGSKFYRLIQHSP
jgi:subtilisin-like proprotein convertase family protein